MKYMTRVSLVLLASFFGFASQAFALGPYIQLNTQLGIGSRGAGVTNLQNFLASNPMIYPQGSVTGYYGPLTAAAVSRLQVMYGLPGVGRVGPQTLALINNLISTGQGLDLSAPVISNVSVSSNAGTGTAGSSRTVTVSWNTNEAATGAVYYSTVPITGIEPQTVRTAPTLSGAVQSDTSMSFNKNIMLSNLSPNTTYYYTVESIDQAGNVSVWMNGTINTM